jgi:hypothetical protein
MKHAPESAIERWWSAHQRTLSTWIPATSLLLFMLMLSLFHAATQASTFFLIGDAGYGDTYILYDVQHYQHTGQIYRDLSLPPYLPAQYSPLVYMMYAVPRWTAFGNPYFGPRLIAIATFLLCVAITVSIVRALIPDRYAWLWGLLLSTSIQPMMGWAIQLRGDFAAIFCGLAAIRLLLAKPRYTVLLAGLSAGLATQFKFVYITSLLAGSLWLLFQKKFREFGLFVAGAAVTSIGLYFLFWLREPRMLAQMLALSPGVPDFLGAVLILLRALETPVLLLAVPALPFLISRMSRRWALLLLFASISFAIATATVLQAGANINYYFELFFAVLPLATLGTFQLLDWSRTNVGLALFVTCLVLSQFLAGATRGVHLEILHLGNDVRAHNDSFRKLSAVLRGQKILSTVPYLALLDPQPPLIEPSLAAYESKLGKFNEQPLILRVEKKEFDVVFTRTDQHSYRGIPLLDPHLQQAIEATYEPHCTILDAILYLSRNRRSDQALVDNLRDIGCKPIATAANLTALHAGEPE